MMITMGQRKIMITRNWKMMMMMMMCKMNSVMTKLLKMRMRMLKRKGMIMRKWKTILW